MWLFNSMTIGCIYLQYNVLGRLLHVELLVVDLIGLQLALYSTIGCGDIVSSMLQWDCIVLKYSGTYSGHDSCRG